MIRWWDNDERIIVRALAFCWTFRGMSSEESGFSSGLGGVSNCAPPRYSVTFAQSLWVLSKQLSLSLSFHLRLAPFSISISLLAQAWMLHFPTYLPPVSLRLSPVATWVARAGVPGKEWWTSIELWASKCWKEKAIKSWNLFANSGRVTPAATRTYRVHT